jgi:hypothetical protein
MRDAREHADGIIAFLRDEDDEMHPADYETMVQQVEQIQREAKLEVLLKLEGVANMSISQDSYARMFKALQAEIAALSREPGAG